MKTNKYIAKRAHIWRSLVFEGNTSFSRVSKCVKFNVICRYLHCLFRMAFYKYAITVRAMSRDYIGTLCEECLSRRPITICKFNVPLCAKRTNVDAQLLNNLHMAKWCVIFCGEYNFPSWGWPGSRLLVEFDCLVTVDTDHVTTCLSEHYWMTRSIQLADKITERISLLASTFDSSSLEFKWTVHLSHTQRSEAGQWRPL